MTSENIRSTKEHLLWGWESFCEEIGKFLKSSHGQYGTANEQLSQYVIKSIHVCNLNMSSLRDHLHNALDKWRNNALHNQEDIHKSSSALKGSTSAIIKFIMKNCATVARVC